MAALLAARFVAYSLSRPHVCLSAQADDFNLDVAGEAPGLLTETSVEATELLATILEEELRLPVARSKTVVAATSAKIAAGVAGRLGHLCARAAIAPVGLGTGYGLQATAHKNLALQAMNC